MEIRWDWIADNIDVILLAIWQHIVLTAVPLAAGFVISLGLAIWASRKPWVYGPVTAVTGVLYTIPSLAAFALLVPVFGFSMLVAFVPLTTYTLLILFRNIVAGFQGVPRDVLEAADGMGYRSRERLLRVEIPLAVPLMITGIRLATVTLIGLATVAVDPGLELRRPRAAHHRGPPDVLPDEYVLGAVLSVLLAFVVDFGLVRVERLSRRGRGPGRGAGGAA